MEQPLAEYGHAPSISDTLQKAVDTRHWEADRLAHVTALPVETVRQHLQGELQPTAEHLSKYSAALGLSRERLLADAAVEGSGDARSEKSASLLAVQRLLAEVWDRTTDVEREQILCLVEQLHETVQARTVPN